MDICKPLFIKLLSVNYVPSQNLNSTSADRLLLLRYTSYSNIITFIKLQVMQILHILLLLVATFTPSLT